MNGEMNKDVSADRGGWPLGIDVEGVTLWSDGMVGSDGLVDYSGCGVTMRLSREEVEEWVADARG